MNPRDLKGHKLAQKQLESIPEFKLQKRNRLPKPFTKLGGPRIHSTGMIDVSMDHVLFMFWRDGPTFKDRAFYGYLFCKLQNQNISPLFEFHWHPSHKGFHAKVPCRTIVDYTNRTLPKAPELALNTDFRLDPKNPNDLLKLVMLVCQTCGINLPDKDSKSERLC